MTKLGGDLNICTKPEVIDPYFYDIERWIEEEREDPSQKYRIVVGMRSELDLYRDVGEIMNELVTRHECRNGRGTIKQNFGAKDESGTSRSGEFKKNG